MRDNHFFVKQFTTKALPLLLLLAFALSVHPAAVHADETANTQRDPNSRSDSPYLQTPDEWKNVPYAQPPNPDTIPSLPDNHKNELVVYNVATGQTETLSLAALSESGATIAEGFEGLLPYDAEADTGEQFEHGVDSVIGVDDRARITPTTSYPWRTIVKLFQTYPDGSRYICSGSMVDNFHVLTAGHCVYSHSEGAWASSVQVVPAMDDDDWPYASANVTFMRSYTGWTSDQNPGHDWALLTLDRNIGSFTGWLGRQWASTSSSIYNGTKNVAGYPGDIPSGNTGCCLYYDADSAQSVTSLSYRYSMDTAGGMSGSPVWRITTNSGGDTVRYTLAVHAYGVSSYCNNVNCGTRLNEDKFNRINTWRTSDTAPTDRADLIDDGQSWSGFSPTTISAGSSFSVYNDVRNIGTASSGSFSVRYYASTNTTISTSDYLIGTETVSSISPFSPGDSNWTGTFPSSIPTGSYYVGWIIDSGSNVTEFDESNNIAYKTSYKLTVTQAAPSTPTGVSASDGTFTDKVRVTWNSASGASSYKIYRNTSNSSSGRTQIGTSSSTTYDDTTAVAGTTYYYWVKATNSSGDSGYSSSNSGYRANAAPSAPTGVSASDGTYTDRVRVTWNTATGASGYKIYRNTSNSSSGRTQIGTSSNPAYDDMTAVVGTTYYYWVKATSTSGDSGYSSSDSGYVGSQPSGTVISISPASSNASVSTEFCVDVSVTDVTELGSFEFKLSYQKDLLQIGSIEEGAFLGSTGRTTIPVGPEIDNANGIASFGAASLGSGAGPSGSGILAKVCLTPQAEGNADLKFDSTLLTDVPGASITHTSVNGSVNISNCYGSDVDCDGDVDIVDIQRVAAHWNTSSGDSGWDSTYDMDNDGDCDIVDIQIVASEWGWNGTRTHIIETTGEAATINLALSPAALNLGFGETISLNLDVTDAVNLGGYEVDISYNPALLRVDEVNHSDLMGSTGRTGIPVENIDNTTGVVEFGEATFGAPPAFSGSGTLATIVITGLSEEGNGTLDLHNSQATEGDGTAHTVVEADSTYTVGVPTAVGLRETGSMSQSVFTVAVALGLLLTVTGLTVRKRQK